ncbi:MAG: cupredoxin domain-containing protein [Fidelibacterota bacterium]
MRKQEIIAVILVILCTVGTVLAIFTYESSRKIPDTVELLARTPDRGNWSPILIRAKKDQEITLIIRNVDIVSHGFYLPSFDVMVREIKAGEIETVTFTPDEVGKHPFYCSVWCSDYHMHMRGDLVVE